ncbi:hypothetical protein T484DRAFT_2912289 [Baffinella frigidus]|nr:hypothetical protein T484DRAFT_2912289 [Cryptophyta sp. CCMP2293]
MPSREEPRLTHRLRDPKGVSIRGSMQAHVLGLALLLVELAWSAGSQPAAHPDIEILSPLPDQPATLPLHVRFRLSAAGRAIVAVDGFVAQSFSLTEETGLEASISLSHLSLERHLFSIDLLAPDDSLLFQGPRWEVEIVDHAAPAVDDGDSTAGREDETAGWEVEPCESFDPDMTEEERGRAEELDGWLLVREHIDFTTLEPTDSCEDAGWVTRARPRRVWDTFQFFNELDILELRLHELNSTVHR